MVDTTNNNSLKRLLKASPLFSQAQEDVITALVQHAHKFKICKKEYICFDSKCDYFYIVNSGSLMLSRVTQNGEKYVIDILMNSGIFGVTHVFHHDQNLHLIAEALENTVIWQIPISDLREAINRDNSFSRNFLCMNLDSRLIQDLEIEHRTVQNVTQRIGCYILSQCTPSENKPINIKLPYNKAVIAEKLGVRSETFSRALLRLQKETGIQAHGSNVYIQDMERLKSYVCPSCSLNYPCYTNLNKTQLY